MCVQCSPSELEQEFIGRLLLRGFGFILDVDGVLEEGWQVQRSFLEVYMIEL